MSQANWSEYTADWTYGSGVYSCALTTSYTLWNRTADKSFTDFEMSVCLKKKTYTPPETDNDVTGSLGVVFRKGATGAYCLRYEKVEHSDPSYIELGTIALDTTFTQISTHTHSHDTRVWEYWKIICHGSTIRLLTSTDNVTWVSVVDTTDTTYTTGQVGLISYDKDAYFKAFKVEEVFDYY